MVNDISLWIEEELLPELCNSDSLFYDDMESQSSYSLPVIYRPFDGCNAGHWADRGSVYDFLCSTRGDGKNILDFGPGDGWPSLLLAPYAKSVTGIESSKKRTDVCRENAERLGIHNVSFVYYESGSKLPFEDNSFDCITAATSVEQSPDPAKTLKELYRVLKPEGRLRFSYESLSPYRNSREQEVLITDIDANHSKIVLYDRNPDNEYADHYGITLLYPIKGIISLLEKPGHGHLHSVETSFYSLNLTVDVLKRLKTYVTRVTKCRLNHPSGKTFMKLLSQAGFSEARMTHTGKSAALNLFDSYDSADRPKEFNRINELIKPVVRVVIDLEAPLESDSMITAVK